MKDRTKKSAGKHSNASSATSAAGASNSASPAERRRTSEQPDARGLRVVVVVSRYHSKITSALEEGARAVFMDAGGQEHDLTVVSAPGSFELPVLCAACAKSPGVAAVVALGCVIRGETRHDRYINDAVTRALAQLSVESGTPIGYGLLTVDTPKQARERAGGAHGNKGADAMSAALLAARVLERLSQ